MAITKTIVVLAKSIKHGKYCIAGKDIESKEWLRPVSDKNGAELSYEQSKCINNQWKLEGNPPYNSKILQKLEIKLLQHVPLMNQPENYLVSEDIWQHKYNIEKSEIKNYLDEPDTLWGEGDRVNYSLIQSNYIFIKQSLYLVKVDNLSLFINEDKKRRVSFRYRGILYDFSVTDPCFDSIKEGNSQGLDGILCISLGENFNGFCYKIVATVF